MFEKCQASSSCTCRWLPWLARCFFSSLFFSKKAWGYLGIQGNKRIRWGTASSFSTQINKRSFSKHIKVKMQTKFISLSDINIWYRYLLQTSQGVINNWDQWKNSYFFPYFKKGELKVGVLWLNLLSPKSRKIVRYTIH